MKDINKRSEKQAPGKKPGEKTRFDWGGWRDWVNIALMYIVLEITVLSLERANWIEPQPSLSLVLFLSLLVVYFLVKLRVWAVLQHLLAVIIGLAVTLWQTLALINQPDLAAKFNHLLNVFQSWWQGSTISFTGDDKLIYAVFITLITWLVGYLSIWFIMRKNYPWVAVTLGAVVLLFNISNLPDSYYIYFILYFFAAVLLIAVTRLTGRSSVAAQTANYSGKSLFYLGISLLVITAVAASFAWITPQAKATGLQEFLATRMPWQQSILDSKLNIFNAVPSKLSLSTASSLKDLPFGNTWNQKDDVDFVVTAEHPSYWQINTYDTYTSQGWTNGPSSKDLLEADTPWTGDVQPADRAIMKYAVTTQIDTDVLLTNGGFISTDIPVRVNTTPGGSILAVTAMRVLEPGERYIVTSYVSSAEASDLSGAGENYPASVRERYLDLPVNLPQSIILMSQNVTSGAATPYAKVVAIRDYLARFPYKLEITPLPEGADSVEYFLFERKNGFCLHFASAMVVMLRSQGVPSRLSVGYLPGEAGDNAGQYLLKNKDFHAWAQVYFPDYGWINIEATPATAGSPLAIDTPFVSSEAIEGSPNFEYQPVQYPYDFEEMLNAGYHGKSAAGNSEVGSLSFIDKLWRALLFIFTGAVIIALAIGLFLLIRSLSFGWLWRVDRDHLAQHIYANMCKLATMAGFVPRPEQTTLEFTAVLTSAFPGQAENIEYITRLYLDSRFGGRPGKPDIADEAEILKLRRPVFNEILQRFDKLRRRYGQR